MKKSFIFCLLALTAGLMAGAPAKAAAATVCEMRFTLSGWSAIYKTASGVGTITCDNGEKAKVNLNGKGGGLTAGKYKIRDGYGKFSEVANIEELFGSYAQATAEAGAVKSLRRQRPDQGGRLARPGRQRQRRQSRRELREVHHHQAVNSRGCPTSLSPDEIFERYPEVVLGVVAVHGIDNSGAGDALSRSAPPRGGAGPRRARRHPDLRAPPHRPLARGLPEVRRQAEGSPLVDREPGAPRPQGAVRAPHQSAGRPLQHDLPAPPGAGRRRGPGPGPGGRPADSRDGARAAGPPARRARGAAAQARRGDLQGRPRHPLPPLELERGRADQADGGDAARLPGHRRAAPGRPRSRGPGRRGAGDAWSASTAAARWRSR